MSITNREERVLQIIETARAKKARFRDQQITLAHGAGGKASRRLVEELFLPELHNPMLDPLGDAALVSVNGTRLAFTTESYGVDPCSFLAATSAISPS